ncbi:MAG TPA: hypothetical protein VHC69_18070 [Polyangiaceae bacterium]|nr:hypothetical protein [Polyangiaceae bacterium]
MGREKGSSTLPREFAGSMFWRNGTDYVRVSLPTGRKRLPTPARDDAQLETRRVLIVEQAKRLLDAGFTEENPEAARGAREARRREGDQGGACCDRHPLRRINDREDRKQADDPNARLRVVDG